MDKDKKKKDDWIRLASKSRPGRFYLFNKATGETQWLPSKDNKESNVKKHPSPPRLTINKASKTPAQDRLKRLQHTLKLCQTKVPGTRHLVQKQKKSTEQENEIKDKPSTSSTAKSLAKSPKKETKRSHSASSSNETYNSTNWVKSSVVNNRKEINLQDPKIDSASTSACNESVILETSKKISQSSTESISNPSLQNEESSKGSTLSTLRSGIVRKIKEICKIPFNSFNKLDDEKLPLKEEKCSIIKTTKFKPENKTKVQQRLSTSAKREAIINQIKTEKLKSPENKIITNDLVLSTPNNRKIPVYPKGSANSRLERLKQSLLAQQQSCNTKNNSDISSTVPNVSTETNNNINTSSLESYGHYTSANNCINSSINNAISTLNNEVEAMDWQPTGKEEDNIEISSSEPTLVVEKSKKLLLNKTNENENQTMGDIIDTVNENLLRFSAEKQKGSINNNKKWRKDFYYFIVDTNVLLRDLTFMEDLTKMKLCDTKGSMLYIPYSVLQELDKLKMRSGLQEGVKTLAVRAIKYLNSKFENSSPYVQAQSALDERNHLIDINSADDSIMNCCLQAKQHVPNIILLTEDVNLRNKAICNNVMVSTKSDLVAKRYDSSDIS